MILPRWTTVLILAAWSCSSRAVGLGPIQVESALGQPLRASIPVMESAKTGLEPSCVKARVESLDGGFLTNASVALSTSGTQSLVTLTSSGAVNEPAISVQVILECGGRVQRQYSLLLDLPTVMAGVPPKPPAAPVALGTSEQQRSVASRSTSDAVRGRLAEAPRKALPAATVAARSESSGDDRRNVAQLAKRQDEKKISQSVLKLSSESVAFSGNLKITEQLGALPDGPGIDPASLASLKAAQRHFAAVLRGEDPTLASELENEASRRKITALEVEKVALLRDKQAGALALEDISRKTYPATWVAALGGLLIFALGTVGWLALRLRRAGSTPTEWWKANNVVADDVAATFEKQELAGNTLVPVFDTIIPDRTSALETATLPGMRPGDGGAPVKGSERKPMPYGAPHSAPAAAKRSSQTLFHGEHDDEVRVVPVEEVSDIVQEAEFWMLLNDPQRAIQMLEPHVEGDRPESPVTWLYLLDLYKQTENREKYEHLSTKFKRFFNARIPKWDEDLSTLQRTSLEDFPNLMDRIVKVWGDEEASVAFLESLLIDDRNGEREGFDLPVYKDIILLIGMANESLRAKVT